MSFSATLPGALKDRKGVIFDCYVEEGLGRVEEAMIAPLGRPLVSLRRYLDGPDPRSAIFIDSGEDEMSATRQVEEAYGIERDDEHGNAEGASEDDPHGPADQMVGALAASR